VGCDAGAASKSAQTDRLAGRYHNSVGSDLNVEPFCKLGRPTFVVRSEEAALDGITETTSVGSAVSRGKLLDQLFKVAYFAVITAVTIGWASAIGWITVRLTL
jgi:hypothetical protein